MTAKEKIIKNLESEIKQLRSAVNELKILNEIAVVSGRSTDIDEMLNTILNKCISCTGAEQGSISLLKENKNNSFKTFLRRDDFSSIRHPYHIGSDITGWVLLNKQPLIIEDLKKDIRFNKGETGLNGIHSVICVPVWIDGSIAGIMMMLNKKGDLPFSNEDLTLLSIISVQVGQMMKNLTLQKEAFEKKKEAEIAKVQSEKLIELDKAKSDFFENISHEFRTPLTLIIGPAKKMLEKENDAVRIKEYTRIINNSEKLMNLINQILDLSRAETGLEKLKVKENDILKFAVSVVQSFYPAAESKSVELKFIPAQGNIISYFDPDKIEKILTNLISNAFKFTNPGGKITVAVSTETEELVKITVEDTGIGISPGQLDKIFQRFYRVERMDDAVTAGTGIGLALVKELIEIHRGKISVESVENKGTKFTLLIPKQRNSYGAEEISGVNTSCHNDTETDFISSSSRDKNAPIIMVAEDNIEVRKYLVENLCPDFNVIESADGKEGLMKTIENIPDLVISDICMPGMDGIELCAKIKSDERTGHIPVILLTAKSGERSRLEGLETGADDYITKPFDLKELRARINNLIEQRKNMRRRFGSQITLQPKDIAITSADERFLKKIMSVIDENISDPSLNVNELSDRLCMSRVQLFRKVKALTDKSVVEFIRSMRLKRALKLLEGSSGNISEIAYDVGFSNPAYFSECFRKQFGKLPSEYLVSIKS